MKRFLALLFAPLVFAAPTTAAPPSAAPPATQAVFSGGCFWCMEHDMKLPGVISVESGYTGGKLAHPSYEDVSSETTGHYESVRVTFDPKRTSYGYILSRYWKLVDPTDADGQFCDRGPSYRTAIFVSSPAQRREAEASKLEAQKTLKTGRIVTPILPLGPFWPAEAYHRDYARTHSAHYVAYREGCGRDARLAQVWGGPPPKPVAAATGQKAWWSLW